ncbi:MAG: hypothetical protein ACKVX7_13650 [Planctomycetota bacterium]
MNSDVFTRISAAFGTPAGSLRSAAVSTQSATPAAQMALRLLSYIYVRNDAISRAGSREF